MSHKCVSLKYEEWYEFKNHRWIESEKGRSLQARISEQILTEYLNTMSDYAKDAAQANNEDRDKLMKTCESSW